MARIQFRYGIDWVSRCGLLLWSAAWLFGIVFVLCDGKVNSQGDGGSVTYTRADHPATFWTLIGVAAAMVCLGLAIVFEWTFHDSAESQKVPES